MDMPRAPWRCDPLMSSPMTVHGARCCCEGRGKRPGLRDQPRADELAHHVGQIRCDGAHAELTGARARLEKRDGHRPVSATRRGYTRGPRHASPGCEAISRGARRAGLLVATPSHVRRPGDRFRPRAGQCGAASGRPRSLFWCPPGVLICIVRRLLCETGLHLLDPSTSSLTWRTADRDTSASHGGRSEIMSFSRPKRSEARCGLPRSMR